MLKTIQRENNCYPRSFFKEINAIFQMIKCLKFRPKLKKCTRKCRILKFLCNFCLFFQKTWWLRMSKTLNKERFVVREASLKRQKQFEVKKCIKFGPKLTKYLKIQKCETFMQFLCTFRKTWWLRMLKTFEKKKN